MNEHRTRTNRRDDGDQATDTETVEVHDVAHTNPIAVLRLTPTPVPPTIGGRATRTGTSRPQGDR